MTSAQRESEAATREGDLRAPDAGDDLALPGDGFAPRDDGARAVDAPSSFAPLVLQSPLEACADGRYGVAELLAFHDRAFVESAYRAALGREPSREELSATLADLRALRREKIEIVEDLIGSEEGRRAGASARVAGIERPGWKRSARRLPFVGYVWRLMASILRLPVAQRHGREFEAYALAQQQLIVDHLNAQSRTIDEAFKSFQRQIDSTNERFDLRCDELRARIETRGEEARALIEDVRALVNDSIAAVSILSDALAALAERQSGFERRLDGQQEFIAREQQAIVEAQKAALVEIEARLTDALAAHATPDAPSHDDEGGAGRGEGDAHRGDEGGVRHSGDVGGAGE